MDQTNLFLSSGFRGGYDAFMRRPYSPHLLMRDSSFKNPGGIRRLEEPYMTFEEIEEYRQAYDKEKIVQDRQIRRLGRTYFLRNELQSTKKVKSVNLHDEKNNSLDT